MVKDAYQEGSIEGASLLFCSTFHLSFLRITLFVTAISATPRTVLTLWLWLPLCSCCISQHNLPSSGNASGALYPADQDGSGTPGAGALTVKIDPADVLEEHAPFHGVHLVADAHGAGAEVRVHAVQGVGHGVHGIDHKLHLALLFVLGVSADPLVT